MKIIISPHFIDEIHSARVYHICAEGKSAVSYVKYKSYILLSVEIFDGIDAEIILQVFSNLLGQHRLVAAIAKYQLVRATK